MRRPAPENIGGRHDDHASRPTEAAIEVGDHRCGIFGLRLRGRLFPVRAQGAGQPRPSVHCPQISLRCCREDHPTTTIVLLLEEASEGSRGCSVFEERSRLWPGRCLRQDNDVAMRKTLFPFVEGHDGRRLVAADPAQPPFCDRFHAVINDKCARRAVVENRRRDPRLFRDLGFVSRACTGFIDDVDYDRVERIQISLIRQIVKVNVGDPA